MELMHPALLSLLPVIPIIFWLRTRRKRKAIPLPGLSNFKALPRPRFVRLPLILLAVSCALLIISAARPRVPLGDEEQKIMGVDVALALDVSGSMKAEDFKPNRIEAAKSRIKEFIANFKDGRMALVAFAGRSFTQCPLTVDGGILTGLLDQLDVGSVTIDGTAIGDAVINCINKFKEPSVSRMIILLTDGENNSGRVDPITAARAAQAKGIKIYAIGVGTPEGAPIPVYNAVGEKFYLQDPMGNTVLAKVDEETLKQMAAITGGSYFRAKDENALRDIYTKISQMEKKEIKIKKIKGYRELFPWSAGAGLVFMLAGAALGAFKYRTLE